ncbi:MULTISPECIES: hypothetical protein [Streptomycetaceae]|uniref:hypothetical protein n=1 Tax=Streptomycetaceae TaxID=2062 RepID=UPI00093D5D2E|nr:hypothetical protein [Streptomyces sp. CB02056]
MIRRLRTRRRYDRYDLDDAEERLALRQAARYRCSGSGCALVPSPALVRYQWTPVHSLNTVEQAWKDLRSLCARVIAADSAPDDLAGFIDVHYADGIGARVLACLLHLADDRDGARWWWQYAAGAGDHTSVYCLLLDHLRRGELHDATWWSRQLADDGFVPEQWDARAEDLDLADDVPGRVSPHITRRQHPTLGVIPLPSQSLVPALRELASTSADAH